MSNHNTKIDWYVCDNPGCDCEFCKDHMAYVEYGTGNYEGVDGVARNESYKYCGIPCLLQHISPNYKSEVSK